jgi:hypothetical protein
MKNTPNNFTVEPAFMLLFSTHLSKPFSGFGTLPAGVTPFSPEEEQAYLAQFVDFEGRLLGDTFLETHRITRWPLGRVQLSRTKSDAPSYADVSLIVHKSGVALWEAWFPAASQMLDAARWIAWLDQDADDGLPAQLWKILAPINRRIAGSDTWSGLYFPTTLIRASQYPFDTIIDSHGSDIIRLLFLDHSPWILRADVVREELEGNYCMREGGLTLLGRRSAVDVYARERGSDDKSLPSLPPRAAYPLIITMEILLIERATLQHVYGRLSENTLRSVDELLALKQDVLDALEEYYGAITTATRFSEAVTSNGEQLLGIIDLYDAVIDRLESVSFDITTRYQKRQTVLQFWLTIVFGAVEIGWLASGIASWYYPAPALFPVLAWTIGTTLAAALILSLALRKQIE